MKIFRLLGIAIIILGMLLGNSVLAQTFSIAPGSYAFVYNGFITPIDQMQSIPIASVGQIVVDGEGNGTVTAVMNIGGFAILNFASNSTTLTVDEETGLGTAKSPVTLTAAPETPLGTLPPGIDFSDGSVVFDFNFVIDEDGALNIIGTKLSAPDGTAVAATVGRGIATPQESSATQ